MLGHPRFAALIVCLCLVACGDHSDRGGAGGSSCKTVGPAPRSQLPQGIVSGAKATAIITALQAIFAAQTPPVSPGTAYSLAILACGDIVVPGDTGVACSLTLGGDGGSPIEVRDIMASSSGIMDAGATMLAQDLFNALGSAVSMPCFDPHGVHVQLQNVLVTANEIRFDDASNYGIFDAPNIQVRGPDAQALIDAFAAGGIDDCDPARNLFIVCGTLGGALSCGYQWMNLVTMGASELVPVCGPGGGTEPGPSLDEATSLAIWTAMLKAASDAGFQPSNGTIAQATVINADYFTWDGTTLSFLLVVDDPTPPLPPTPAGDSPADGG